ncbi:MAG: hypothetical protein VB097_09285 [Rikenellaceae bacterium]|nr:hypothetical protein [Rikenellaceae bacterium]
MYSNRIGLFSDSRNVFFEVLIQNTQFVVLVNYLEWQITYCSKLECACIPYRFTKR